MEDLVITAGEKQYFVGRMADGRLLEVYATGREPKSCLGNIYVGKVQNVLTNIEAAFVEYEKGKTAYLSFKNCPFPLALPLLAKEPKKNAGKPSWRPSAGDELILQIEKDGVRSKVPAATCRLNFPGRYAVLVHGEGCQGISSKITDKQRKRALAALAEAFCREHAGIHFVLRTNAASVSDDVLLDELEALWARYRTLLEKGKHRTVFSCLAEAPAAYAEALQDSPAGQLGRIIAGDRTVFGEVRDYLEIHQPECLEKLSLYPEDGLSINAQYNIEGQLKRALSQRVWLKSGAYLVIEPTEALTVIDVNTGKAVKGKKKREETLLKINREAAAEIAFQLCLRNLSGIIIIDFIDMEEPESRDRLIDTLKEAIAMDRGKTEFVEMTKLYLVELTRKRGRKPLHEIMGQGNADG